MHALLHTVEGEVDPVGAVHHDSSLQQRPEGEIKVAKYAQSAIGCTKYGTQSTMTEWLRE